MSRVSTAVRFLALGAVAAALSACGCTVDPEAGEYCGDITSPQASVSVEYGSTLSAESTALLAASLRLARTSEA